MDGRRVRFVRMCGERRLRSCGGVSYVRGFEGDLRCCVVMDVECLYFLFLGFGFRMRFNIFSRREV